MRFSKVIDEMLDNNKRFTRAGINFNVQHIYIMDASETDNIGPCIRGMRNDGGIITNWVPNSDDMVSDEWMEFTPD